MQEESIRSIQETPNSQWTVFITIVPIMHTSAAAGGNNFWVKQPRTQFYCFYMHFMKGIVATADKSEIVYDEHSEKYERVSG